MSLDSRFQNSSHTLFRRTPYRVPRVEHGAGLGQASESRSDWKTWIPASAGMTPGEFYLSLYENNISIIGVAPLGALGIKIALSSELVKLMVYSMKKVQTNLYLSIIIPAYNERKRIEGALKEIASYLKRKDFFSEVIIIDDGSTDKTQSICESIIARLKTEKIIFSLFINKKNRGKGYSVKKGISQARGKYILYSDADLSTPIEELDKLLSFLEGQYDIAIASRALENSQVLVHQSWYREKMGQAFNLLVQLLVLKGIKDTQCGFKCFKKEAARKIFPWVKTEGFAFDVEALFLAKKLGFQIKEVPVKWIDSPDSKVCLLRDSLAMLLELIKIRNKCKNLPLS